MAIIRTIGMSGQVSLGKAYAGRTVLIDESQPGTWVIKLGKFIPDNEKWLFEPAIEKEIDAAIQRVTKTPAKETNLKSLTRKMRLKDA